jgi:hypothetical protein
MRWQGVILSRFTPRVVPIQKDRRMRLFAVTKPGGTTNHEFDAYKGLLEEVGIDLSNVPRVQEPGTGRRWLYVWHDRAAAQAFARELGVRTRDSSWVVHEFDLPEEELGPLAPLDVIADPVTDGTVYLLSTASQERILRRFPNARLAGEVFFSHQEQQDHEREHGPIWDEVILRLSGLSKEQVNELGGYRVYEVVRRTLYESAATGRQSR